METELKEGKISIELDLTDEYKLREQGYEILDFKNIRINANNIGNKRFDIGFCRVKEDKMCDSFGTLGPKGFESNFLILVKDRNAFYLLRKIK